MQEVTIPALGMAMTEAILTHWFKQPGDVVTVGDVLAEIETDKSAVELESPADGTLGPHLVTEGDTVPIGDVVVRILAPGESGDGGTVPAVADGAAGTAPGPGRRPHTLSPRRRRLARLAAEGDENGPAGETPTGGPARDAGRTGGRSPNGWPSHGGRSRTSPSSGRSTPPAAPPRWPPCGPAVSP